MNEQDRYERDTKVLVAKITPRLLCSPIHEFDVIGGR